ncbi:MAG: sulfatase [Treponema sp.]|nr:sulfatase [Treponema sp.]
MTRHPNVIYIFSDQQRAQDCGYAGNPDIKTPNMDALSRQSVSFRLAVSGSPVCSPYRASLLTGQYPLTHKIIANDVCLGNDFVSLAQAFTSGGYETAYIGKWHLDGHGRSNFIPRERRQGFNYWKVLECTHDYNNSYYYSDTNVRQKWDGYDAEAQTRDAQEYIKNYKNEKPFLLVLSWGPPHNPYETAPQKFKSLYDPAALTLRPNVPPELANKTRTELAGYYAHISALDCYLGEMIKTVDDAGLRDNTLFIFTSDHGDMIGSQGQRRKQRPWDESILTPFLLRYPALLKDNPREILMPINTPDIMPTLLDICDLPIPATVEGVSYRAWITGEKEEYDKPALIQCTHPFGEFTKKEHGKEYRGIRTMRYTYVRDLNGPWLLYDNLEDPYQMKNLAGTAGYKELTDELDHKLQNILDERKDKFFKGEVYMNAFGYEMDENGTVPFTM